MSKTLRVLNVEDSENDARLVCRHLTRAGYEVVSERVETAAALKAALEAKEWDVILCDYSMPQFNALRALAVLKETGLDIPLIIISGTIGEDVAVGAMLAGANDYLMKDNLVRLVPTIERLLGEVAGRRARQKAEEALHLQAHLLNTVKQAVIATDLNGQIIFWNHFAEKLYGWTSAEVIGRNITDVNVIETLQDNSSEILARVQAGESLSGEFIVRHRDGRTFPAMVSDTPIYDPEGKVIGMVGVSVDITERKLAEEILRESEQRYRMLFENNPQPMWVFDEETLRFLAVNEAATEHYGYTREEFLAMTIRDIRPPEDVPALMEKLAKRRGRRELAGTWRHLKKDGQGIDVEITTHQLTFAGRSAELVLVNDVTERQKAEAGLKEAEEKYRSIFENAVEGIYQSAPDGSFISANPALARILGYETAEELIGHRRKVAGEHYFDPDCYQELMRKLEAHGVIFGHECEVYRQDRSKIWTRENIRVIRDREGGVAYFEGAIEDVSERKGLEEQLRQSQKMEAIGRLAGGVAHDFNNMLAVIMIHCDLTLRTLKTEDPLYHRFEEIRKAGERASTLTRQLLAFSRKQVQKLRVINLNTIIADMEKMLRRLIGEDIEMRTVLQDELGSVKADPGQIEQVVMNLVINTRDAMPEGGKLTIETKNVYLDESYSSNHIGVEPGYYAMLAITDTGIGMDKKTQERIFDPFFTTKEVGKGTGLGLATVYGIVKQTGGSIWVYSEPGVGTTFKIYLPRVDERAEQVSRTSGVSELVKGTETILLAEDEQLVRNLAREVLEMHGYKVLEAANGGAAFLICERHQGTIHMLLTDVVMPEMSGAELAKRLGLLRPEMRVLYMSGYTDNAIIHHGVLDEGTNFIQKPFSADALAQRVREILDAPARTT